MLLNSASRQYILNEALGHAFGKRKLDLDNEYDRIAKQIYDALFTRTMQEHINALPKSWFVCGTTHRVNVGGHRREWKFNGTGEHGGPKTDQLRLPTNTWSEIGVLTHDKNRDLIERIATYDVDKKALDDEKGRAEHTLMALLKGLKTVEQLKEVWPEGHRFYKGVKAAVPTPPGLPAIAMADLNKLMGLTA